MPRGSVSQVAVPPSARALSSLPRIDYEEAFLVETGPTDGRTSEQWARAVLEDAPSETRHALRWGWFALGLKHGPTRSDRFVLGWEVRRSTPDLVLLGSDSRIGMPAELLLERRQDKLLFAAFLQHKNPIARAVWAATVPGHQRVVRSLLERVSSPEAAPREEPAKAQEPRLARLRRAR